MAANGPDGSGPLSRRGTTTVALAAPARAEERSTLIALVETQAARTPDRVAAIADDGTVLTYADLLTRANRFANHLGALGVGRGSLVGVGLERSLDMLVALFGILRAGAAYVPLDPRFPPSRLRLMTDDADLGALITETATDSVFEVDARVHRVVIDGPDAPTIAATSDGVPNVVVDGHDLAYVIYTSGSTGRPKGVMVEHHSLHNLLTSMAVEPGLAPTDRLLAITTLSFDIAGLELWLPLTVGATLVIASSAAAADPHKLFDALTRHRITVMQATPTTWRMLLDADWPGDHRLKVLCGGEALPPQLATALFDRVGELWNMYGPTETTVWSTIDRVVDHGPVCIGRPIANTTTHVLDPNREPVAHGAIGELYIGGSGVARGYLGRDDLTAERFVTHPAARECALDQRLYRTGDLVRRRDDGRIEFVDRVDRQVKLHGFRVELGEIETVLAQYAAVKEAAVVLRHDDRDEVRLVAYVTAHSGAEAPSEADLRRYAATVLPHYMVPNRVIALDAMPRTPNAKIDRAAMPAPDWSVGGSAGTYVAPRDEVEARLAALWQDELGLTRAGVHDDFFDLGVESLVAARLFARMARELGVELPVSAVFANPTIASLASAVRERVNTASPWKSLVAVQTHGQRRPLFAVHGGAGTILLFGELARCLAARDRPLYALQAQGLYGHDPVHATVEEMANAYVREIRSVQPEGPYVLAGYCFGALVAYEMARVLQASGERVQVVASINGPTASYIRRHDSDGTEAARASGFTNRVRNALRYRQMMTRRWLSTTLHRPLPAVWRERDIFQVLAIRAQFRYAMPAASVNIAVFRAHGLYAEDDLGWRADAGGSVQCFEVPGLQRRPRDTMDGEAVRYIAEQLDALAQQVDAALP